MFVTLSEFTLVSQICHQSHFYLPVSPDTHVNVARDDVLTRHGLKAIGRSETVFWGLKNALYLFAPLTFKKHLQIKSSA